MASGSGRGAPGGIRIQEPGDGQRDESNAAATAAAAPPPPAPPSDGRQERPHGPSAAAAEAARKGKGVLAQSPLSSPSTSSKDTSSLPSPEIVSEKGAGESSSADTLADGDRKLKVVTWNKQLVEATVEVPKVTRPLDAKSAFDILTAEQQWALAEEMERRQRPQAWQRKSLWSKIKGDMANVFLERIGRQMHNSNPVIIPHLVKNGLPRHPRLEMKVLENVTETQLLFWERIGRQMYNSNPVITPHVNHQTIPTTGIIKHYNLAEMAGGRGVIFHSNELNLRRAYSEFRPVLGDGECFYRSFIFSYLEQVLDRQDTHEEHRLLAAVKGVARHHARLGWTSEFSQRYKAFKTLIKKVMRWKRDKRFEPTTDSYRKQKLLKFFSCYGRTDDIFAFLRLVAAIWICSHSEEFEPIMPELSEYDSLRDWCFHEVITYRAFTDHFQITALVTALGVPLRVEYLLQGDGQDLYTRQEDSQDNMPKSTCWPGHRPQLPHAHVVPRVTVLYTNIHYDIIYPHRRDGPVPSIDESSSRKTAQVQRPTAKSSGQQIAQRDSCSGKSSSQHIAQVETSTSEIPDQHAGPKLTSTGAHESDEHMSIAE